MNTRIYKNEFDPAFIEFLKKTYKVETETETVLELTDITEEQDRNFHAFMFKSYDELIELLPGQFSRFEDEVAAFVKEMHDLYYGTIIKRQIKLQETAAWKFHTFDTDAGRAAYEKYAAIANLFQTLSYLTK